jgi:amidase
MPGGRVVEHVVTRTVRDCAALLDAIFGPYRGDPYVTQLPDRPFLKEVGANPGRLRIAFSDTTLTGDKAHEDCIKAVRQAAKLCEDLCHDITEAAPRVDSNVLFHSFITLWSAICAWAIDEMGRITGQTPRSYQFEPFTWAIYEKGKKYNVVEYLIAECELQKITCSIASFFINHDVWVIPTVGEPPVPLGPFEAPPEEPMRELSRIDEF